MPPNNWNILRELTLKVAGSAKRKDRDKIRIESTKGVNTVSPKTG